MGVYQGSDFKKISGGRKKPHRDIRKYELGEYPSNTTVSSKDVRVVERTFGGNTKVRLKYAEYANVFDPESKTYKRVKILGVVEVPANRELARRGIVVKGAVVQTELGKAKVLSRPGQEGVVNAILLKD